MFSPLLVTPLKCLADDLFPARDVIPNHVTVQFAACREKHAALGRLGHLVGETHVFGRLVPASQQEDIYGDAFLAQKVGPRAGWHLR